MVKVLIYSTKDMYDNSSYDGRAEADIIAHHQDGIRYNLVKNTTSHWLPKDCTFTTIQRAIHWIERDEFQKEFKNASLVKAASDLLV